MAQLADAGWRVVMATAFTATVLPATGFALACQLDKGLGAEVDYMALRREEDRAAAAILGVADLRWLGLAEAPHRGYGSAAELFGEVRPGDDVWRPLAACISGLLAELRPGLVLVPQGLGNHVDHRQMIRAVAHAGTAHVALYRDTPYALRDAAAGPDEGADGMRLVVVDTAAGLARRIGASCAYGSQIGFQFGGAAALASALEAFALREGGGRAGERYFATVGAAAALRSCGHQAAIKQG